MNRRIEAPRRPGWRRAVTNRGFVVMCIVATSVSGVALAALFSSIIRQGHHELIGIDDEAYDAARDDQVPDLIADLYDVDWAALDVPDVALSDELRAALPRVDWNALGAAQDFEYADEIEDADWAALATAEGIPALAEGDELDWFAIVDAARVPGRGPVGALWEASKLGQFVTDSPSRRPENAGIGPALWGTVWICGVCAFFALPIGVATAIFLEEYKPRHPVLRKLHGIIELNITNLAGVPSIVYGIIGLTTFVQMWGLFASTTDGAWWELGSPEHWFYLRIPFGRGVLAGGLTLMLVILPIVIISAQEALRAVPSSLRQGPLALGATRQQMIFRMTLPAAIPSIMTGAILAMSRAIGEAAPVLVICGIVFIRFTPQHLMDEFTAMPLQIYDWAGRPQEDFHRVAASGIIVLLTVLLSFNAFAIFIRQKFQKPLQ